MKERVGKGVSAALYILGAGCCAAGLLGHQAAYSAAASCFGAGMAWYMTAGGRFCRNRRDRS